MSASVPVPEVGDERRLVVVEDLRRTQLVQYAGASGDYNPIHTDEVHAREALGFPGVFAHGMLTMGLTGRVVTDWFGPATVRRIAARFRQQVWPGDTLTATATVRAVRPLEDGEVEVDLDLVTTNQHEALALTGSATVHVNAG